MPNSRSRHRAARIIGIRHRRRNNFDKSEYGSAIREFPAKGPRKERLPKGRNSFPIMCVKFNIRDLLARYALATDIPALMSGRSRKGRGGSEESER